MIWLFSLPHCRVCCKGTPQVSVRADMVRYLVTTVINNRRAVLTIVFPGEEIPRPRRAVPTVPTVPSVPSVPTVPAVAPTPAPAPPPPR